MANTITNLIKDGFTALEIVSRKMVGIIPAVTTNFAAVASAKDTTIRNSVAPAATTYSITPSMTPLAAGNLTYANRTIALDTLGATKFHFAAEEEMGLRASNPTYTSLFQQNVAQGMEALVADMSNALTALYYNSSRAYGAAGTTPFGSDLSELSAMKTILDVNGAPVGDRHCLLDHAAGHTARQLTQLTNVNQAGDASLLRNGQFANVFGFKLGVEDKIKTHTVGTSTGQDVNGGDAAGTTSITYDGGDGGTILVGDTVTFADDTSDPDGSTSRYVVNTAITAVGGELVINSPGLVADVADTKEIGLGSTNYVANLAFSRDAFVLAARPPKGGDSARFEQILTDPVSGLSFRLAEYAGYHMKNFELSVLYGVGLGNPEHSAILMG